MRTELCAYCGKNSGTTRDHVIPKGLFAELPKFMVTVPACTECHGPSKSEDDAYLRDMLILHHGSENHPVAKAIANGSAWRASETNRSKVANALRAHGKLVSVYKDGLFVGEGGVVPLEEQRVRRIFSTLLRGLYYQVAEQMLPVDAGCEIKGLSTGHYSRMLKNWKDRSCNGPAILGQSDAPVFSGYYFLLPDPYSSAWLVTFYGGAHYFLRSHRPGDSKFKAPDHKSKSIEEIDHWDL